MPTIICLMKATLLNATKKNIFIALAFVMKVLNVFLFFVFQNLGYARKPSGIFVIQSSRKSFTS